MKFPIRIGTDCSGIEAPIQALIQMKIPFRHLFSSEIDKYARESIKANYSPEILFDDMTKERKLPKLDIYVCGFPCQPFSSVGKRLGSKDPRSNIFLHCVDTIINTSPTLFILENVKGIINIENGIYFEEIKKRLNNLSDYSIVYWILNTKDYGIPQNRERLYIVGIKNIIKKNIQFPKKIKCRPIESYIDHSCNIKEKYSNTYKDKLFLFKKGVFVNVGNLFAESSAPVNPIYSSTLTTHPLWCVPMHRKATIKECLALQGFSKNFKQVVSDSQMRKQIGNSMSVNVLIAIFKEYFLLFQ